MQNTMLLSNYIYMSWCSFRQVQLMLHLMGTGLQNQRMMTCQVWWRVQITWNFLPILPR